MVKIVTWNEIAFHPYHFVCPHCHREWYWDDEDLIYCEKIVYDSFNVIYGCSPCLRNGNYKKKMTLKEKIRQRLWIERLGLPILLLPERGL